MKLLSRSEYEEWIAKTRDERMDWWRRARFGMFVHFGLYSQAGRHEWMQTMENCPVEEYEKLAESFNPKPGAPREWAALAKKAGMKYMVLTTRHHEGFSLWDSKANPFNSVNYGPKRDIVREFVDACREHDLKIGFYSSLMDWHHPDSWRAAFDSQARARFHKYILDLNTELLTQYGKIDILWFDVAEPMVHWEGWNSLEMNQKLRALQPDIIMNNRSRLDEDFGTPEEHIRAEGRDWEACMTFNGISWGYVDSKQAARYSYNAQEIIRMLNSCASGGGNLLLNIGPAPDGSVPEEAVEPLTEVGEWLKLNGKAVYGKMTRTGNTVAGGNGLCGCSLSGNSVYLWNWIWPSGGTMAVGGYKTAPKSIRYVHDGTPVEFEHKGHRIILKNLPEACPAPSAGITVLEMEFDGSPEYCFASYYPQLHGGREITAERL
jgi:alpha-L-fucosidase